MIGTSTLRGAGCPCTPHTCRAVSRGPGGTQPPGLGLFLMLFVNNRIKPIFCQAEGADLLQSPGLANDPTHLRLPCVEPAPLLGRETIAVLGVGEAMVSRLSPHPPAKG